MEEAEQVMTHQPAISFSISLPHHLNRAGGRTSNVRAKVKIILFNSEPGSLLNKFLLDVVQVHNSRIHVLKKLIAASLVVISQSFAAEPTLKAEWPLWEVSLTRTDTSGKTLSQAKAPLTLDPDGCFNTQLVINMGTVAAPCLWTVECMLGGPGDKLLNFEVDDTNRTVSWISDGNSTTRTAELFDIETTWHGAGRYLVFTMDGETLTADIHPVTDTKIDHSNRANSTVIVVTRRDRSRNILSHTTAPWPAASEGDESRQRLAIHTGTKDAPHTWLVQCTADLNTLIFTVEALLPIAKELGGTQVRRLFLLQTRSPINASGKYLIQELDGETLEAEIRPAGQI